MIAWFFVMATHVAAHHALPREHVHCTIILHLRVGSYDGAACPRARGPTLYHGDAKTNPRLFWELAWDYRGLVEGDET